MALRGTPLDEDDVIAAAHTLRSAGVEAVAVALLHAYRNPSRAARRAVGGPRDAGVEVALSSRSVPNLVSTSAARLWLRMPTSCRSLRDT